MSSKIHLHHIIPRHMGGDDSPENLIMLSIEEHADAHRILYEQYNKTEDYIAWKALLGQINSQEISDLLIQIAAKRSAETRIANRDKPHMVASRKVRSEKMVGENNPMYGVSREGEESTNLKYIFVTPNGNFFGMGDAIKANPGIPIRKWCLDRSDEPFKEFKKSMALAKLGYTKEEVIGKTPRDFGYYIIEYDNQQPSLFK